MELQYSLEDELDAIGLYAWLVSLKWFIHVYPI